MADEFTHETIETVKETLPRAIEGAESELSRYASKVFDSTAHCFAAAANYVDNAMRNWKPLNLLIAGATICGVLSIASGNETDFKTKIDDKEFSFNSKSKKSDPND